MLKKAFLFACEAHRGQLRKDGSLYISHPFAVATELAKNGAGDELICAGLLHDVIEDAGITKQMLAENFGSRITALVCRDSEDKSLSWEQRKQSTIDALKNNADREMCMLVCADKLANLRDVYEQLSIGNTDVWSSFKRGKDKQEWLYREMLDALSSIADLKMYNELEILVNKVFE